MIVRISSPDETPESPNALTRRWPFAGGGCAPVNRVRPAVVESIANIGRMPVVSMPRVDATDVGGGLLPKKSPRVDPADARERLRWWAATAARADSTHWRGGAYASFAGDRKADEHCEQSRDSQNRRRLIGRERRPNATARSSCGASQPRGDGQSSSRLALAVSPACGSSSTRNPVASWPGPSSVDQLAQEKFSPVILISPVPTRGSPFR